MTTPAAPTAADAAAADATAAGATADAASHDGPAPAPLLRRIWNLPFRWHAAALALVLLALLPLMATGSAFTSDEGAYALQAQSLDDGDWVYDYRAAPLDPERANFPLPFSARAGDSFFAYVSHPAYPVLLAAGRRLAGPVLGFHLVPLLGALLAAAAAWLLAAELDPGSRRLAFWLVAAGPVVANGYLLWAHSLSAALAGAAVALAVRVVRRGPRPLAVAGGLALALAAGALLRSEGVLLALVVAVAVAACRVRRDGIPRAGALLLALVGPTGLAVLVERWWTAAIVGGASGNLQLRANSGPYLEGRITGAWHELFNSHYEDATSMLPVLLTLGLVVGLGSIALKRWGPDSRRDLTVVAVSVVALVAARVILFPHETVTGLLAAWPLALLGVLLLSRSDRVPQVGLVLAVVAGFTGAILLTQYPEGGGLEWGGRFLSPVGVPLGVLAAIGLRQRLGRLPSPDRRWAAGCLSVVGVATALLGILTIADGRAGHDGIVAAIGRHPAPVMVTTVPGLPRVAWRTHERQAWMLTDTAGLPGLLDRLEDKGIGEMAVVTDEANAVTGWPGWTGRAVDEPALREVGLGLFAVAALTPSPGANTGS